MALAEHHALRRTRNPHLLEKTTDHFHHLGFAKETEDLEKEFGDVKVVCMGGSVNRIREFAEHLRREFGDNKGGELTNLCGTDRYVLYKVGSILAASHGMGVPSITILLHELFKLLDYAKADDVVFIRMGTCGGIGVQPGTVVVSQRVVDGLLRPFHEQMVLGRLERYLTNLDDILSKQIASVANKANLGFEIVLGDTMCCHDFYEGQARIDGAFCNYSNDDKLEYLRKAQAQGVINIEMESLAVASLCLRAGIKAAVVCVALLNRLETDEVLLSAQELAELQSRPWKIVSHFLKGYLNVSQ